MVLCLQVIKPISISGGQPSILLPLIIVIGMSAGKDMMEDRKRKLADREENESFTLVGNKESQRFDTKMWQDVKVGHILKVNRD
jgi:hypothetical protein